MPEKHAVEKAKRALRAGKSASTAAGEFIREEMDRFKHDDDGPRSRRQAIAIGLAKAPETAEQKRSRRSVERAYQAGSKKRAHRATTRKRSRARAA
jgi:hypothetical protein